MSSNLSTKVSQIEISGIRKFYNKVQKVPGALSLTLGQPDFFVPDSVKKAMINAINENKTVYTPNAGIVELREEISKYLNGFGIEFNSQEICVTVGGSEALMAVFAAILNKGDKVLIPAVAYPAYKSCIHLAGGEVIEYGLRDDFSIDVIELRKLIKNCKPKVIVLSYPSNPTGAILNNAERDALFQIIKKEDIIVVTDEIYSALCYGEYYSIAQYKEIKDKVIYIGGFSKMLSMTGLRIGYVCAEEHYMKEIIKVHQYTVSCAASIAQYGALTGLRECKNDVEYMKKGFKERRDYVYNRLLSLGFKTNLPEGAFYIFPNIEKFNMSSDGFCEKLLVEEKVAVVPGTAFGIGGEGYIRISYCYSMEELTRALDCIKNFIKKH